MFVALKKCRTGTDALLTKKHKERWSKEVEIMQRLNHPNVVKAVPVPQELLVLRSELPLMCMEYCSKGDLRQVSNIIYIQELLVVYSQQPLMYMNTIGRFVAY